MCFSGSKYTLNTDTQKEKKEKDFRKKNWKELDEVNVGEDCGYSYEKHSYMSKSCRIAGELHAL